MTENLSLDTASWQSSSESVGEIWSQGPTWSRYQTWHHSDRRWLCHRNGGV